ncbi:MAG: polysaccharide biosynthesis C-terminal domain-containing protein [Chloroflexia bacterium]
MGRLKNEALAWLLARATNLALGLGVLLVGGGVWGLAVVGNLAMLAAIVFSYRRLSVFVRPAWRVDRPYWRRMLGQPTAIGVGVIFSIISFRVDNLLIPPFSGSGALGLYNVAYKLFEPSQILPATLLAATFPLLSQAHISGGTERSSFKRLLAHNLWILLGLASAITLLIVAFSGPVVNLLYGIQYAGSAPVLRILALACIPMYLNYALTHALTAIDQPRLYAIFTLVTIAINVAANLVLLPTIGIEGAAWATVITEVALFALCALAVFRLLRSTETVGSRQPAAGSSDGQILPTADRLLPAASESAETLP